MDVLKRWFDWLPIASHPPLSQILVVGLMVVMVIVVVLLVRPRRSRAVPVHGLRVDGILEKVSVQARPLMNNWEVAMFNLLLLAVREHFLLLAKVPLKSLVQLRTGDETSKRLVRHAVRKTTVDFVVVHPGTQRPVKAIFVGNPDDEMPASGSQEHVIDALLHTAEIEVIRLDQETRYRVEQLTELLGLTEEA